MRKYRVLRESQSLTRFAGVSRVTMTGGPPPLTHSCFQPGFSRTLVRSSIHDAGPVPLLFQGVVLSGPEVPAAGVPRGCHLPRQGVPQRRVQVQHGPAAEEGAQQDLQGAHVHGGRCVQPSGPGVSVSRGSRTRMEVGLLVSVNPHCSGCCCHCCSCRVCRLKSRSSTRSPSATPS